jgi:hypothetical protein
MNRNLVGSIYGRSSIKIAHHEKQELPVVAMFINGSGQNVQVYREPSIDAAFQVSVHLVKRFQRRKLFRKCHSDYNIILVSLENLNLFVKNLKGYGP